jgi:hypothetical protein
MNRSCSCCCVDLQIGDPLRTAHSSPIRSDQVVLVPSLFGSDLSTTTFWDLRQELEPVLRAKYGHRKQISTETTPKKEEGWSLESVKGGVILVAPSFGAAASAANQNRPRGETTSKLTATATGALNSVDTRASAGAGDGDGNVDDDGEEDEDAAASAPLSNGIRDGPPTTAAASATRQVARRLCEYYSIDPRTAVVNGGIMLGRPNVKLRPAHSYVRYVGWFLGVLFLCRSPAVVVPFYYFCVATVCRV